MSTRINRSVQLVAVLATLSACTGPSPSTMATPAPGVGGVAPGEGLFRLSELPLAPPVARVAKGVVRVQTNIRFELTLFADSLGAAAAMAVPGARSKRFLPGGGSVWPVFMDTAAARTLCAQPGRSVQPGFAELCHTHERITGNPELCRSLPCAVRSVKLEGSATGFAVGTRPNGDYLIATNYHVAREDIERHTRQNGVYAAVPVPAVDATILVPAENGEYVPAGGAMLVANASQQDWREGRDWAFYAIPRARLPADLHVLALAEREVAPGDTLWAFGFPTRTRRSLPANSPYANADDELRVSWGFAVMPDSAAAGTPKPSDILSTLDGVAGNSGSPVVNRNGEVVGIFRAHTHIQNGVDARMSRYGGFAQIVAVKAFGSALQPLLTDSAPRR